MAMSQSVLSTQLAASMGPAATESAAIDNLVAAYAIYAADATALTSILSAGIDLGKTAMASALVGMSAPGAGAAKFVDGFQEFWVGVAGGLTASFAGATAISPPPFAGLLAALQPVFDANRDLARSLEDSMDALATAIHLEVTGGTVTTAGPTVTPII